MNITEILKRLCEVSGVSGEEANASLVAKELISEYAKKVEIDDFDNVIAEIYDAGENAPKIMLDAHIDEIGFVVTYITDEGFLKVAPCGGVDKRLLLAQEVIIHGKENIKGIVGTKPPHLTDEEESKKVPDIDKIYIDTGFSKEQVSKIVSLGDRASINSEFTVLQNGRVSVKSLDDRACVTAILYALELLKDKKPNASVSVLFSSQEEAGGTGATVASYKINPDEALVIDVSFAYTSDAEERKCGKMGEGPMIGVAPILNRKMTDKLISLSKEKNYPYQLEIMEGKTGTNADEITVTRNGVKTAMISLSIKYMHTPVEVVEISDIEAVGRLIAEYILSK